MKIITDFKIKDNEYKAQLAEKGDVIVTKCLKYIVTECGYISESGTLIRNANCLGIITAVIKRDRLDTLEHLLIEGEKRCSY